MVYIWTYRNPPPQLLEEICRKNVDFNLEHAAAAPRVRIDAFGAEALGADLYRIHATVANHGYLPTHLSDVAISRKVAKTVHLRLDLSGAELVMNPADVDLGHLAGRNERTFPWSPWGPTWSPTTKRAEWLVRIPDPARATVRVIAASERAGTDVREVRIGG
jgi:murein tripeptide amidase MpaA